MSLTNEISSYCRNRKIRQVNNRSIVADHLITLGKDVDGDQLWRSLRKSDIKISLATVYHTLNWLVEAGFIEKKFTKERRSVFAVKVGKSHSSSP